MAILYTNNKEIQVTQLTKEQLMRYPYCRLTLALNDEFPNNRYIDLYQNLRKCIESHDAQLDMDREGFSYGRAFVQYQGFRQIRRTTDITIKPGDEIYFCP